MKSILAVAALAASVTACTPEQDALPRGCAEAAKVVKTEVRPALEPFRPARIDRAAARLMRLDGPSEIRQLGVELHVLAGVPDQAQIDKTTRAMDAVTRVCAP